MRVTAPLCHGVSTHPPASAVAAEVLPDGLGRAEALGMQARLLKEQASRKEEAKRCTSKWCPGFRHSHICRLALDALQLDGYNA